MNLKHLKGDLSGGFVAGIIALPLALAFGVQSGLGATAGLYGAIAVGVFAALLGGTPTQASGPTGPMTVVSASIVVYAVETTGSLEAGLGLVLLAFFAGGLFQLLLGFLRVGKYVRYFPYPVISGFMSGVGLIIVFLQLWPFLGSASPKSTIEVFTRIGEPIAALNISAVALGTLTLVVNYATPKVTKAVPSVLVALVAGTAVAYVFDLEVPLIGDIPSGLPLPQVGAMFDVDPGQLAFVLESGVTLALLGSVDSLLTSVIADNLTKTQHDSNRELIGQGIGNMIAAVFGGIPGAGATKGTVVNINAGGKTRLSGVVHGLLQLVVLLGAGSVAAHIPLCVLAGLLISVGVAIIDVRGFKHIAHVPRADAVVMLVVLVWTVFGNLIHAVGAGIVLASILFMKKSGDLAEAGSFVLPAREAQWPDEAEFDTLDEAVRERVYIKHLEGPLFFGFSAGLRALGEQLKDDIDVVIVRMERVPYIDQSGLYALEDSLLSLERRGVRVLLTGVAEQPLGMLRRVGIVPALVSDAELLSDPSACVAWIRQYAVPGETIDASDPETGAS